MELQLTEGLHCRLRHAPDAIATAFEDRRQNWREVGDRSARLASVLQGLDRQPNDRVGMLALNSDRYLEYMIGG